MSRMVTVFFCWITGTGIVSLSLLVSAASSSSDAIMCAVASTIGTTKPVVGWSCGVSVPYLSVCAWTGVSCDQNTQQIIGILLDSVANGLIATAATVSILFSTPIPSLQSISMYNGHYNTTLPTSIVQLTALTSLVIENNPSTPGNSNTLTGTIPTEISALTQLRLFDLTYNNLRGVYAVLCRLLSSYCQP